MGWVDGFGPSLASVAVFGWPGLEEHLREILRKQREEREREEKREERDED